MALGGCRIDARFIAIRPERSLIHRLLRKLFQRPEIWRMADGEFDQLYLGPNPTSQGPFAAIR